MRVRLDRKTICSINTRGRKTAGRVKHPTVDGKTKHIALIVNECTCMLGYYCCACSQRKLSGLLFTSRDNGVTRSILTKFCILLVVLRWEFPCNIEKKSKCHYPRGLVLKVRGDGRLPTCRMSYRIWALVLFVCDFTMVSKTNLTISSV